MCWSSAPLPSFAAAGQSCSPQPNGKFHIALPVDGLDAARLRAFEHLCEPAKPKLVVTARRARSLGIEADGPVSLALPQVGGAEAILSLAEDAQRGRAGRSRRPDRQ